ncbi:hypothetical protein AKI39_18215 [Bordetella sp. H567]|uniref:hypothetical protein n=1 Tax=Bordetella sp. H567 TaxID=1697043 RepID=UPI00081D1920|nr:hypothetical protein [Bordetella sp. H567]AOB32238.1 hypothetical protein AKI39_18215 [Bordetella sp. H567]
MPANANEPVFDVLWPLSRKAVKPVARAPRVPDLNGKVICELWDVIFRGEAIYPLVREYIKKRFPGVKFVTYENFGNFHGAREHAVMATIPDKLKHFQADAVIVGIGA